MLWVVTISAALAAFLYWLLVMTEGVYLGQKMVTRLYDFVAPRYDRIKGFDPGIESLFLGEPITDFLRDIPAPCVLDVGTGTARFPLALCENPRFQGRVIGIDDSLNMLKLAGKKITPYQERITLLWQDSIHLPFEPASFDAVAAIEMLEFVPDSQAQLSEITRVLKSSGLLVITRRRSISHRLMPGHVHSCEAFESLLREEGYHSIERHIWQQDYDLYTARKSGTPLTHSSCQLTELLRCPTCGATALYRVDETRYICDQCQSQLTVTDKILLYKAT